MEYLLENILNMVGFLVGLCSIGLASYLVQKYDDLTLWLSSMMDSWHLQRYATCLHPAIIQVSNLRNGAMDLRSARFFGKNDFTPCEKRNQSVSSVCSKHITKNPIAMDKNATLMRKRTGLPVFLYPRYDASPMHSPTRNPTMFKIFSKRYSIYEVKVLELF